ncbi:MAG: DUF1573 domain-containing protein [Planctomycetota bacterium]
MRSDVKPSVDGDRARVQQSGKSTQGIIQHEYSFGQVPINSTNEHQFTVTNIGNIFWTIKNVHLTCSCVVSSMSSESIAPGATEEVAVKLVVGDREGRLRQDVLLEFEEAGTPMVRLRVLASVRRPISCSREIIVVNPVRVGAREEEVVEVGNYSKDKWDDLVVDKTAEWVAVEMYSNSRVNDLQEGDAPLQRWNVAIIIDGSGLSEGWNVTTLSFHPKGRIETKTEVVVRAHRTPAVLVEPSTVFCGIVARGKEKELKRTLRFTFRTPSEVPAISDIKAGTTEVPMSFHWRKDSQDPTALLLECMVRLTGDTLNDHLAVDFGKARKMRIPVRGSFRDAVVDSEARHDDGCAKAGAK